MQAPEEYLRILRETSREELLEESPDNSNQFLKKCRENLVGIPETKPVEIYREIPEAISRGALTKIPESPSYKKKQIEFL